MPPEGPNKAEELLQRYAKKRREQAPDFSLHPATRRVLQGEVTRQHGSSAREKTSLLSWFGTWRGRAVFGIAAASTIVIVSVMVWNAGDRNRPIQLAMSKPAEESFERRPQETSKRDLAEVGKQMKLAETPSPALDARSGLSIEEKSSDTRLTTDSLSPVQNLPAPTGPAAAYYFSDSSGVVATDGLAGNRVGRRLENATSAASPPAQLGYSVKGVADAQPGFASPRSRSMTVADSEANLSAQLGRVVTNGVMLADKTLAAKDSPAMPLPARALASADAKRFSEAAQVQLRVETKAQTDSFGVSLVQAGAEDDLARNRKLNFTQPTSTAAPAKPGESSEMLALGVAPSTVPADPIATLGDGSVTGTFSSSTTGSRADFDAAPVFYRQSDFGSLPQVAQQTEALQKKKEATPQVLSRFTVEQTGANLRLREADGSVYEGAIDSGFVSVAQEAPVDEARAKNEGLSAVAAGAKAASGSARSYSFRAVGSNVTLRQNVVVNGRFSAGADSATETERLTASGTAVGGAAGVSTATRATARPVNQPVARREAARGGAAAAGVTNRTSTIEGTVRVGLTNEQRFRAVQSPR